MRRKNPTSPSRDPIENDFLQALRRLQDESPNHKALKAAKAVGKLKINFSTVAQEAGHSRTLIALENSRYPRVREAVRIAQGETPSEPRTSGDLINKLRADIAELRVQLKKAEAHAVEHFDAREKADRQASRWKNAYDRLLKKLPTAEGNVVQYGPRG
jgi:hypothetical protein